MPMIFLARIARRHGLLLWQGREKKTWIQLDSPLTSLTQKEKNNQNQTKNQKEKRHPTSLLPSLPQSKYKVKKYKVHDIY